MHEKYSDETTFKSVEKLDSFYKQVMNNVDISFNSNANNIMNVIQRKAREIACIDFNICK